MKEKKERDQAIEYQAGSAIVDDGIRFNIPFVFGRKLWLSVRPLRPGTLVMMSQQALKLKEVNEDEAMIREMLRKAGNLRYHCRILALACLNDKMKIILFGRLLTRMIMWRVKSTEDLFAYLSLAYRQSGAQHFFFITALTQGMNFLERKNTEKTGVVKPSGEQ